MDRKKALSITCLIIPFFFICVLLCFIHLSQAEEYPPPLSQTLSEIVLTDVNGQEFSDGILLDNFEYWNSPEQMGWEFINLCYPYPYSSAWHPTYLNLNNLLDFDEGSKVLDVYIPPDPFLLWVLNNQTLAVRKKAAYINSNGVVFDSIPDDFHFLHFKVRAPLAVEQCQTFRFEVEVTTKSNGHAKIVIIPKDKVEGVSPVDALETVEKNVETISHDPQNPSLIDIYIGNTYGDGDWHQVKIDLNAAIRKYSTLNEQLDQILSVMGRGNQYRLDDILFTKTDPHNNVPHIFNIGPIYFQLYGQIGANPEYRWIYAEDPDLMIGAERTETGMRFPGIADFNGIVLEYKNEDLSNQNIDLDTLHVYEYGSDEKIVDYNTPRSPDDADLQWRIGLVDDTIYFYDFSERVPLKSVENGDTWEQADLNMLPPYLMQTNGVIIWNKLNTDPDDEAYGLPLKSIQNPIYALAVALGNSGYEYFPTAAKLILPTFGQTFEDCILTCQVTDDIATFREYFPVSVVNYPVTNHPPIIITDVEDQVFEVGVANYYQIVAYDPDPEDMIEGLTYYSHLDLPFPTFNPWNIIDSKSGLITFTPHREYDFDCQVRVSDPHGSSMWCEFTIFCKIPDKYPGTWVNHPPVISGEIDSLQTIRAGEKFIANEIHFMDPDEDKMYWSSNVGSVGNNGVYTFQTMFPGDYQVQITAYDIRGGAATTEFMIHVTPWWSL